MKNTFVKLLLLGAVALFSTSCGDDMPAPEGQNTTPPTTNVKVPSVVETSISINLTIQTVTFKASCPEGTNVKILVRQLTNGTMERELDVSYNSNSQLYYSKLPTLTGGSKYSLCIIGFDTEGKEVIRTAERTFDLPKEPAPEAPATIGIKAYSPTSAEATDGHINGTIISKSMEYSIDEGKTWKPVTEAGTISNLPPCHLRLRYAETPTTEASQYAVIEVPAYHSNTDLDGTGGTSEGLYIRRR